jgi:hypothetical protein
MRAVVTRVQTEAAEEALLFIPLDDDQPQRLRQLYESMHIWADAVLIHTRGQLWWSPELGEEKLNVFNKLWEQLGEGPAVLNDLDEHEISNMLFEILDLPELVRVTVELTLTRFRDVWISNVLIGDDTLGMIDSLALKYW